MKRRSWPVLRQIRNRDALGLGLNARSGKTAQARGRVADADHSSPAAFRRAVGSRLPLTAEG